MFLTTYSHILLFWHNKFDFIENVNRPITNFNRAQFPLDLQRLLELLQVSNILQLYLSGKWDVHICSFDS